MSILSEENEKFSAKKALGGICKPLNYVKAGTFLINLIIIAVIVIGIRTAFRWFFPQPTSQTQTQTSSLVIERGASVEHITLISSQEQKADKKTVGLEFEASSEDAGMAFKKYINDSWYVGLGARWKFETEDGKMPVKPVIKVGVDF